MKLNIFEVKVRMAEQKLNARDLSIAAKADYRAVLRAINDGTTSVITAGKIADALGCSVRDIVEVE